MMNLIMFIATGGMLPIFAFAHIHNVELKIDQILSVKTALGIATIIETPEAIQSAIVGDQSAFKIEYLNQAVTIKPLRSSARTNLYLQTASRRYDLRLETGRQEAADYVVYLKARSARGGVSWKNISRAISGKQLTLKCVRIARLQDSILLDLKLSSKDKEKLSPEKIWLRQGGDSKVINNLFLSKLETSGTPVLIGLSLMKADLSTDHSIEVSVIGEHEIVKLELPAEALWK